MWVTRTSAGHVVRCRGHVGFCFCLSVPRFSLPQTTVCFFFLWWIKCREKKIQLHGSARLFQCLAPTATVGSSSSRLS
jgi:hypothetical protein